MDPALLRSVTTSLRGDGLRIEAAAFVFREDEIAAWARDVQRVYVGWDFCAALLPSPRQLRSLAKEALACGLGVTVCTAFVPPGAYPHVLESVASLASYVAPRSRDRLEVVVNDFGLLDGLRARDDVTLSAGRLLNKQRRDPRIAGALAALPREFASHLSGSSASSSWYVRALQQLGVRRAELDTVPAGGERPSRDIALSLHFPYRYVTVGRACAFAGRSDPRRWDEGCRRGCVGRAVEIAPEGSDLSLHAFGNALFSRDERVIAAVSALAADRIVFTGRLP